MKNELLIYTLEVLTGFFAIMNPFANLPIFLGLVKGKSRKTARKIAWKSTSMAFIIITLFVIFGKVIFDIFHLTIPAFKMTGGLLIFHVGYEMLQSKAPSSHSQKSMPEDFGVAISPLGIPILAGPGTIITAMNYTAGVDYLHILIILFAFGLITLLTYFIFKAGEKVVEILGKNIIEVIGKIMGLLLAIMGMDMLIGGIKMGFGLN